MEEKRENKSKIYQSIHKILLNDWDPIDVKHVPQAHDEYDAFISAIYSMLEANATEEQIFEQLKMIALENMGIAPSEELDISTRDVARKLKELIIRSN